MHIRLSGWREAASMLLLVTASAHWPGEIAGANPGSGDSAFSFEGELPRRASLPFQTATEGEGGLFDVPGLAVSAVESGSPVESAGLHIAPGFINLHSHADEGLSDPDHAVAFNFTLEVAPLALREVTVVDVMDGCLSTNQTVLIAGDRITTVGPMAEVDVPDGTEVVDASGGYLIPGLWDMHVHITDATELALPILVSNGITGVRDMGGDLELLRRLERERATGERVAPRLVMPGPYVDSDKALPYRRAVETAEDGRSAAVALAQKGVDFIKIHNGVPREAYFALLERALELELPVVGHIPLNVEPEEAARAGQAGVEHFATLFEGTLRERFADDPATLMARYVDTGMDGLMTLFADHDVWFTPTLVNYRLRAERGRLAEQPDPRLRYVAPSLKEQWEAWFPVREKDSNPQVVAARMRFFQIGLNVVRLAHEAGVPLLAGTDLAARDVLPGFHLHDELEAMVEAGLEPYEALQTATLHPARFLGRTDELGTIEVGKLADLVLLDANPLENIENTRRIRAVVVDGRLLQRTDLDEMLMQVEKTIQDPPPGGRKTRQ